MSIRKKTTSGARKVGRGAKRAGAFYMEGPSVGSFALKGAKRTGSAAKIGGTKVRAGTRRVPGYAKKAAKVYLGPDPFGAKSTRHTAGKVATRVAGTRVGKNVGSFKDRAGSWTKGKGGRFTGST